VNGILLDENLPEKLTLSPVLPITHATMLGQASTDTQIWNHARERRLVVVSKDADFSDRIMASSPPPWIVHLRFGNRRLREFRALMEKLWPDIERLLPENKLVCVYEDRIEAFRD
jgi:predicted nuclease of predicted toxin-antitoxin system